MIDITDKSSSGFPFFPPQNTVCTHSFSEFLKEYKSHVRLFLFIVRMVATLDENRVRASDYLMRSAKSDEDKKKYERNVSEPDRLLKLLQRQHSVVLSQNLTNGIVTSFQRYFSSVIQEAVRKRPTVLSSSQTIKAEDVFKFSKHRDLVAFMIDRKVNDLSYGGLNDMEKYFDDHLGVKMFSDDKQRKLLRFFVEVRNINVHNGGVTNDLFASRVKTVENFPYKKGEAIHLDLTKIEALADNAMRVIQNIDSLVAEKFSLRKKSIKSWTGQKGGGGKDVAPPQSDQLNQPGSSADT